MLLELSAIAANWLAPLSSLVQAGRFFRRNLSIQWDLLNDLQQLESRSIHTLVMFDQATSIAVTMPHNSAVSMVVGLRFL
ncbi:hypothetical protein E2542_SST06023 [Spatholobus suberectus]|nr:hypothetical protein E2542_SST06023 [Spatholobus suberectus]